MWDRFGPKADVPGRLRAFREQGSCAWKSHPYFRELARLCIDLDRPAMLLDDDIVADGKAKAGALSGRLGCEERVEHLVLHLGWNSGAVVADPDFNLIAKAAGRGRKGWLVVVANCLRPALGRCIEAVGNQIEQNPCDVLGKHVGLAGGRVQ